MSVFDIFKGSNKKLREEIVKLSKNEISIDALPENSVCPDGSKIGGQPFLPADFKWPFGRTHDRCAFDNNFPK